MSDNSKNLLDPQVLREAILAALPEDDGSLETNPQPGILTEKGLFVRKGTGFFYPHLSSQLYYLCNPYSKLMRDCEDNIIISGDPGSGKSTWVAALRNNTYPNIFKLEDIEVIIGYFDEVDSVCLSRDRTKRFDVLYFYDLWRAVIIRSICRTCGVGISSISYKDLKEIMDLLSSDPEALICHIRPSWTSSSKRIIIFDTLDSTIPDWLRSPTSLEGLVDAVMWLKEFPNTTGKILLRPDQARVIRSRRRMAFSEHSWMGELIWSVSDLQELLWTYLINAPGIHRKSMSALVGGRNISDVFMTHEFNRFEEFVGFIDPDKESTGEVINQAFKKLIGPLEKKDWRCSNPYSWVVTHLADSRGRVFPRSFLASIRYAAEDSAERYPDHKFALHFDSIKRGIIRASKIRVEEMRKHYPEIVEFFTSLKGISVPFEWGELKSEFKAIKNSIIKNSSISDECLCSEVQITRFFTEEKLYKIINENYYNDYEIVGALRYLEFLGFISLKRDKLDAVRRIDMPGVDFEGVTRIDIPGIYRVGFGLGRKGGVKKQQKGGPISD